MIKSGDFTADREIRKLERALKQLFYRGLILVLQVI